MFKRAFLISAAVFALVSAAVFTLAPPPRMAQAAAYSAPLQFSATWNPASIADGDEAETTITASSGVALGDFCMASFSLDVSDLAITCAVTASNVVSVSLLNNTGGAVDLASGTVRVSVYRYQR